MTAACAVGTSPVGCLAARFFFSLELLDARDQLLGGLRAGRRDGRLEQPEALLGERLGGLAGDGLDTAHAGADGALAGDDEAADLAGGAAVRAAAELVAVALDADGAHGLAVLLVEEGVGAGIHGLGHGHVLRRDRAILADDAAHLVLDGVALLGRQAPIGGVVEAQVVGCDQRAGLAGRVAERVAQGAMEHVRAGVVAHGAGAAVGVDLGADLLAQRDLAVQLAAMDDEPGHGALRVLDREDDLAVGVAEHAAIADLTAALGVEGRLVEHDLGVGRGFGVTFGVGAGLQLLVLGGVAHDGRTMRPERPWSRSRGRCVSPTRRAMPSKSAVCSAWRARSSFLPERLRSRCCCEGGLEALAVDAHAVLGGQLDGEVDGEAVGVVQAEGCLAVEHAAHRRARPRAGGRPRGRRRSAG